MKSMVTLGAAYICSVLYTIALWWPPASGPGAGTAATTGRLFLTTSWGQPTSTARLYRRYSAEQRRRPPTRSRWPGCAGGSGVVLELLQLAFSIIWIGSRMSTPRGDHQVCRHPCTSALTGMLTRTGCALLGRLWDHSKEPPMSLFHPSTNCESDRPRL